MRSLLPLVCVLLLCVACGVRQVQADVQTVKLCGREFIRAVVFTCGGSRWRRFLSQLPSESMTDVEQLGAKGLSDSMDSPLAKRDVNHVLTSLCCQMGCRKSDLTTLC